MKQVIRLVRPLVSMCLVAVGGCASAPVAPSAQPVTPALAPSTVERARASEPSKAPAHRSPKRVALRSPSDSDSDCVFLENAARAIEQYRAFIEHAGSATEYAAALTHSRDQITDLQAEMDFVHSGMAARGAQCSAAVTARAE